MASASPNPAKKLLASFKSLGMTPAQVRRLLPAWWDDEAAETDAGLLEMQILLARRLSITPKSLQTQPPLPQFVRATRRFKTIHPESSPQLAVAAGIGQGLATLLVHAARSPIAPTTARALRADILKDNALVNLSSVLTWAWTSGIPVVHITEWPNALRRPDAMCIQVAGRPAILVVRKEQHNAKLTYLVAHELGHILCGHLGSRDEVLVDEDLPVDAIPGSNDDDEQQANAYARELLGGDRLDRAVAGLVGPAYTDLRLASKASSVGREHRLDPGQIVLGWARQTGDWALASMAMRYLQQTEPAPTYINEVARKHLDVANWPQDALDHFAQLTGIELTTP